EWDFTILSLDPYLGIKEGESTEIINSFDLYLSSIQSSKGINFSLSLPNQSEVSFHLFNAIGQVIHIKEIVAPRGKSEYNLPLSLPSGIYFLQIKMRDEIKRKKICIVK
ncbi:T9SS type A sorting domain-containing protein, partial [candidate division WOR-3 bacterium]|nr:T9SS type A sorting domain-containing protein [candidate division WOR-3 bacterium]